VEKGKKRKSNSVGQDAFQIVRIPGSDPVGGAALSG